MLDTSPLVKEHLHPFAGAVTAFVFENQLNKHLCSKDTFQRTKVKLSLSVSAVQPL